MATSSETASLIRYFALCFLISWGIWIPAGIFAPEMTAVVLLGAWAPTIAALLLTWRSGGRAGLRELLSGLTKWRVGLGNYLFAILGMTAIALIALGIDLLLGGTPPALADVAARFGLPPEQALMIFALAPVLFISAIFIGGPIAEELGWRGYAQPRLQARIGPSRAGLIIGFIWGVWHLPLFRYFPSAVGGLPLPFYIPLVSAFGVLFAWLYNRSGGSVLLCILLHAGVNFSLGVVGAGLFDDTRSLSILLVLVASLALALSRPGARRSGMPHRPSGRSE